MIFRHLFIKHFVYITDMRALCPASNNNINNNHNKIYINLSNND